MKNENELYLLQLESNGYIGNSPVFWHKSNSGYTQWLDEAKRFTKDEAMKIMRSTRGTHNWRLWKESDILANARQTVDIQQLRKVAMYESIG